MIGTVRSHRDRLRHLDLRRQGRLYREIYTRASRDFSTPWLRHCGRNDRVGVVEMTGNLRTTASNCHLDWSAAGAERRDLDVFTRNGR